MKTREFWLENANGDTYSLHSVQTFANNPSGLGYAVDINTVRLGNSNLIVAEEYNLGSFSAELMFLEGRLSAYQQYLEFAKFLYARPIILHYKTPATNAKYRCQVRVTDLQKTQVSEDGIMRCPITMYRQTMWYTDEVNVFEADTRVLDSKEYPLQRPYYYGAESMNNISLYNDGVADTPMLIEIDGECTDPMWTLYTEDGEQYGACRMLGTYEYVSVDSNDLEENIILKRGGSIIPNAINYQDLSVGNPRQVFVTFLKLHPGKSKLVFSMDQSFSGFARITWRHAYATV